MTQAQALKILKKGHNVFLTGAAGSGKTYVLGKFIEYLKDKKINVGITASTGIATTHLSGMTIHSWSGIGIKDIMSDKDLSSILGKTYLKTRFHKTNILIIDEISMLHAHRLDMIDRVCRAFKEKDVPFGGMQIVMCGDFFQLPPVTRGEEEGNFAYKSHIWNHMDLQICYLEEQYRQSDRAFLRVLSDIRTDAVTDDTVNYLLERYNQEVRRKIKPTRLYTHNTDVDAINEMELAKIYQIPLRLAWAITIHKSQGMSLDAAEIDLSKSFVPGMGYVALSRVHSLSGMKLVGLNEMSLQVNPEVLEMDKLFQEQSNN